MLIFKNIISVSNYYFLLVPMFLIFVGYWPENRFAKSDVLTAIMIMILDFWDVTACRLVQRYKFCEKFSSD